MTHTRYIQRLPPTLCRCTPQLTQRAVSSCSAWHSVNTTCRKMLHGRAGWPSRQWTAAFDTVSNHGVLMKLTLTPDAMTAQVTWFGKTTLTLTGMEHNCQPPRL